MSIAFSCGGCGKRYEVAAANAGRKGRCARCGGEMTVPTPGAGTEPEPLLAPGPVPAPEADAYALDETDTPSAYSPIGGSRALSPPELDPRPRSKSKRKPGLSIPEIEPGSLAHWRKPLIGLGAAAPVLLLLVLFVPALATVLGYVLTTAGALLLFGGMIAGAYVAFTEDWIYGFFFVVVPAYAAYYFISRWDDTKVQLGAVFLGLALLAAGGWVLERGAGATVEPIDDDDEVRSVTGETWLAAVPRAVRMKG